MKDTNRVVSAEEVKEKYGIDYVTAQIIGVVVSGLCEHMLETLMRGAYSTSIRDIRDAGAQLFMVESDGLVLASGVFPMAGHSITERNHIELIVKEWGPENFHPGDVVFCNDPFRGTWHQGDITLTRPVFVEGEKLPVFYLEVLAHMLDSGGPEPGFHCGATELYAEGLRLPPTLLYSQDVPVRSTLNLYVENTRYAPFIVGDLRACYGALLVGERRLKELIHKYGLDVVRGGIRYSCDTIERELREAIRKLPDGVFESDDMWMEGDEIEEGPFKIKCTIRKHDSDLEIDWSGTERQCLGNQKTALVDLVRPLVGLYVALFPQPRMINDGLLRPIDVCAPIGSMLTALPPASCFNHMDAAGKGVLAVYNTIGKANPQAATGETISTVYLPIFAGVDTRPGRENTAWAVFEVLGGGWGGSNGHDGRSYGSLMMGNILESVNEHLEAEMPLIIWDTEFVMDSAGPGKYRGGFSNNFATEVLCDSLFNLTGTQTVFSPRGVAGGGAGGLCYSYYIRKDRTGKPAFRNGITPSNYIRPLCGRFNSDRQPDPVNGDVRCGTKYSHSMIAKEFMPAGTIIRNCISGGGGYGNPLERDPEKVRKDVWNELVSIAGAEQHYGVIINPGTLAVDLGATGRKREELMKLQKKGKWQAPIGATPNWPRTIGELKSL
jgi:N-methylhydantoinase B